MFKKKENGFINYHGGKNAAVMLARKKSFFDVKNDSRKKMCLSFSPQAPTLHTVVAIIIMPFEATNNGLHCLASLFCFHYA